VIIVGINLGINVTANVSGANSALLGVEQRTNRVVQKIKNVYSQLKALDRASLQAFGYYTSIFINLVNFFSTLFEMVAGSTNSVLRILVSVASTVASTLYMISSALAASGVTAVYGVILAVSSGAMQIATSLMVGMQQENLMIMMNYTQSMFNELAMFMRF